MGIKFVLCNYLSLHNVHHFDLEHTLTRGCPKWHLFQLSVLLPPELSPVKSWYGFIPIHELGTCKVSILEILLT